MDQQNHPFTHQPIQQDNEFSLENLRYIFPTIIANMPPLSSFSDLCNNFFLQKVLPDFKWGIPLTVEIPNSMELNEDTADKIAEQLGIKYLELEYTYEYKCSVNENDVEFSYIEFRRDF